MNKKNSNTNSKDRTNRSRKKNIACTWLEIPSAYGNIIFPGETGLITLSEPLKKHMPLPPLSMDSNFDMEKKAKNFEDFIDRAIRIKKDEYFIVLYKTSTIDLALDLDQDIDSLTDKIPFAQSELYDQEHVGSITLPAMLMRANDDTVASSGKPIDFLAIEKDEKYVYNLKPQIEATCIVRLSIPLESFRNEFDEFSEKIRFDLNQALNSYKDNQVDLFNDPEMRALVENVCDTFNDIEAKKFESLTKQKSKLALSMVEHNQDKANEFIEDVLSEITESYKEDKLKPTEILDFTKTNIDNPIDVLAKVLFISPFIGDYQHLDENFYKFLEFMKAGLSPQDEILDHILFQTGKPLAEYIIERIKIDYEKWKISTSIDAKLSSNLSKSQTEYVLNEKLRSIQNEIENLGSNDETASDKATLKSQIDALKCPEEVKKIALTEYTRYRNIPYSSPESLISRNYIDWIVKLPWYPKESSHIDLKKVKEVLDRNHYGLTEIKEQILEFLAVQNRRGSVKGNIICLLGAPGVGKTSLVKSIAEAMGRDYVRICLGGVRDESEIRGHRRTYLGSLPGKLIKEMSRLKSNDPVILLDEIDKLASDMRGDPASAMLEVLDPEQNKHFVDHYLDFQYDLSNVMFVATANSTNFQKPLLDRMDVVKLSGYSNEEKFKIAKDYLIPRIIKDDMVGDHEIEITDEAIRRIILDYTKEQGVRNLARELDKVFRKAVVKIDLSENVKQITITPDQLLEYLGPIKNIITPKEESKVGYVNGLAYSEVGGDLLSIEACKYKGRGELKLTGKLGDVMKESCEIAYTAVKAYLSSDPKYEKIVADLDQYNIHIHFPDGATPKDGPSAGIAICSAIYSILTGKKVNTDYALTGEISILGKVLPIGGLKEKLQGAINSKVYKIILPKDNANDLEKIPNQITDQLEFNFVERLEQVLDLVIIKD